jgi:hypothetical protein
MYERRHEPLLPRRKFIIRQLRHTAVTIVIITISLTIGIAGYHYLAHLGWVDAFLNASMILGGMGPIDPIKETAAKIFAGCYALFAGIIFLVSAGILFAPILHRLFHYFHMQTDEDVTTLGARGGKRHNPG